MSTRHMYRLQRLTEVGGSLHTTQGFRWPSRVFLLIAQLVICLGRSTGWD